MAGDEVKGERLVSAIVLTDNCITCTNRDQIESSSRFNSMAGYIASVVVISTAFFIITGNNIYKVD